VKRWWALRGHSAGGWVGLCGASLPSPSWGVSCFLFRLGASVDLSSALLACVAHPRRSARTVLELRCGVPGHRGSGQLVGRGARACRPPALARGLLRGLVVVRVGSSTTIVLQVTRIDAPIEARVRVELPRTLTRETGEAPSHAGLPPLGVPGPILYPHDTTHGTPRARPPHHPHQFHVNAKRPPNPGGRFM